MSTEIVITKDSTVNECLSIAFQLISNLEKCKSGEQKIDLRGVQYPSPFFVAPLLAYLNQTACDYDFILSKELEDIMFPKGLKTDEHRSLLLKSKLNEYGRKGCLPIVIFPSRQSDEDETNSVVSMVESALYSQNGLSAGNIVNGLRYVIGEIIDNITQHSHSAHGYFYSMVDEEQQFVDIAIFDSGIGLLGSYRSIGDNDILSDIEAIQAANRGISTKNLPNAENRGFGIITSKKMVIDGLEGVYVMISGSAMLIKTPIFNRYFDLTPEISLNGTIVVFRMPLRSKDFNYISYIE